jgi:hypothetical protein
MLHSIIPSERRRGNEKASGMTSDCGEESARGTVLTVGREITQP